MGPGGPQGGLGSTAPRPTPLPWTQYLISVGRAPAVTGSGRSQASSAGTCARRGGGAEGVGRTDAAKGVDG